jgi:hypothetical protein
MIRKPSATLWLAVFAAGVSLMFLQWMLLSARWAGEDTPHASQRLSLATAGAAPLKGEAGTTLGGPQLARL